MEWPGHSTPQVTRGGRLRRLAGLTPFVLAFLGVLLIAYFVLRPQGDQTPLSVAAPIAGHPAPDFTLRDIDGVRRVLRTQHGHAVLLNFWGINCPPCRHEMPEIWRAAQHLRNQPVTIWGIDDQSDAVSDMRLFTNQIGVYYPQLPDPRLVVGLRYQVSALPVNIFIGPNGRVTLTHVGPLTYPDFVAHLEAALREDTSPAPSH
ncbi:MAG TPA: TlpA disulfide reductase family protein [Chloroflexota bacterium]|nr:TlpA disulfide reductase family protein [Chloroflexota bacterium]